MAKRTAKDLDAELAALEAELAALEQRKAPSKPASEAKPEEPKRKLALPKLGKKAKPEPGAPEASAVAFPAPAPPAAAPPPKPAAPKPTIDAGLWRQEDGAWVRAVPHKPAVVRRVLDENDAVVREEPATSADLEEKTPAKAERGIGRFLRRGR